MLQTDEPSPSVSSQNKELTTNTDGSIDVCFGPKPLEGVPAGNWIRTLPGKGRFILLRLYGPLEPWFKQTWRPHDIGLVK